MKLFILLLLFTVFCPISVFADDSVKQVQHADIAEIMMKKYPITIDDTDFTIFYRFSTVGEGEGTDEDFEAKITSIQMNKERKSLVITLDNIKQKDIMSLRFEKSLVSAEGKRLSLLIDGEEKGYESSSQNDKSTMIFLISPNTTQVEIIGTRVIPEFPSGLLVLVIVSSSLVLAQKLGAI